MKEDSPNAVVGSTRDVISNSACCGDCNKNICTYSPGARIKYKTVKGSILGSANE